MQHQYCLLLNSSLLTQNYFAAKSTTIWLSLYRVEKNLKKSIYSIRKIGTPYMQCVHRIRLRPIAPIYQVEDIQLTMDDFRPDPSLGKYRSEHEIFDDAPEDLLREDKLHDLNIDKPISKKKNEVEYVMEVKQLFQPHLDKKYTSKHKKQWQRSTNTRHYKPHLNQLHWKELKISSFQSLFNKRLQSRYILTVLSPVCLVNQTQIKNYH